MGALVTGLASVVAIAAPGDGQTAMVVFPLWTIGALALVAGLKRARVSARPFALAAGVFVLAGVVSVVAAIGYGVFYTFAR